MSPENMTYPPEATTKAYVSGIIDKNDTLVKMTLPADNNNIVASKYQLYLPTEQQLIAEVEKVRKEWEEGNGSNQK